MSLWIHQVTRKLVTEIDLFIHSLSHSLHEELGPMEWGEWDYWSEI